ncbi:unnamed protein product [Didymodactylos carnosus]|uniref:V(D)J recombination-activating protein 1 RNase H domain-containing protein n=1 Tax=Didymodactylos carnosus TaxID=1234261 RepID=A0A815EKR6_9BILA|nr:unnamed protein product [Didymodactylos carnosus]CAF4158117.1 unnamed protein product [Didymodactylos carnosus]
MTTAPKNTASDWAFAILTSDPVFVKLYDCMDNKKLAALGKELYETKNIEDSKRSLDLDKTLALKNHLDMSTNHKNFCKRFLSPYLSIPNEKYIRAYSNTILPETCVWKTAPDYEPTGVFIPSREDVVCLTIKRLVEMLQKQNVVVPTSLIYREKCGHDGAGSMSMYKSVNSPMETANIFSKMFVPLSLKAASGEVLWINDTPNSSRWCRPLALIAVKESKDLLHFVNTVFEPGENDLRKDDMGFIHNSIKYEVKVIIETSMKDLKIRTMESGLGGADCLLCTSRRADWKDLTKISDPDVFAINRTAAKTLDLYKQLLNDDGEIEKSKNDYEVRQGLTSEPLSSTDNG